MRSFVRHGGLRMTTTAFAGMTLLFLCLSSSTAANKKVGTSGAQFLRIGPGARSTAMGEAFVGLADDINAVHHNPAGLAQLERPELAATHMQYFQDLNYDFGAFACPTQAGTFALSASTLKAKDIPRRGVDESSTGTFENLDAAYGLSYAYPMANLLSIGVTGRYLNQKIDNASANAWSADIGVHKRFDRIPLSLGFAVRHLGQEIKFREVGDPQPMIYDLGAAYSFLNKRFITAIDIKKPRDNDFEFGLGTEWKQPLAREFGCAVRAGYNSTGTDADGASGISLGGGLTFKRLELDFAWVPFGDLGNTFRYAALMRF